MVAEAAPREWSDLSGKYTRHGDFEDVADGQVLVRETDTDKLLRLPLERLSLNDLRFLLTLKRVGVGTLKACRERFAVAENGEFVKLATPPEELYGEILEPYGSHLYRIKSNLGHVAIETLDQQLMPGMRVKGRPAIKTSKTVAGKKEGVRLPVYRVFGTLEEEHLPVLLTAHRLEMVKCFDRQEPKPKLKAILKGKAEVVQPKRELLDVTAPQTAYKAPPIGAHFLDDPEDVKRYRLYREKGWDDKRLRLLGHLNSQLDDATFFRDRSARQLAELKKGDRDYKSTAERLRKEDARVDELQRDLKRLIR